MLACSTVPAPVTPPRWSMPLERALRTYAHGTRGAHRSTPQTVLPGMGPLSAKSFPPATTAFGQAADNVTPALFLHWRRLRLVYIKLGKTGGTSLLRCWLQPLLAAGNLPLRRGVTAYCLDKAAMRQQHGRSWGDNTSETFASADFDFDASSARQAWMSSLVFATVRNPWLRVISLMDYAHHVHPFLVAKGVSAHLALEAWCRSPVELAESLPPRRGVAIRRILIEHASHQHEALFTRAGAPVFDALVRLESAQEDFAALLRHFSAHTGLSLNLSTTFPHENQNRIRAGGVDPIDPCKRLWEARRTCLNASVFYYQRDADMLGYSPPCPSDVLERLRLRGLRGQ